VAGSLRDRNIEIVMTIEADTFEDAAISFLTSIRTALHAAECHAPEWNIERYGQVVRELDLVNA